MTITRRCLIAMPVAFAGYWSAVANVRAQEESAPDDKNLVNDLVVANHLLAAKEIVVGYGHVSVRNHLNPNQYFMARDLPPALVMLEDVLTYDLDSDPLNAKGVAVVNERFIHGEIYKGQT